MGIISASTALKMGDASQLYYTDVAVITVYILYISRLLCQRKRKYSQDVNEAVGCARVVPPYGQLAEGLGNLWKGLAAREAWEMVCLGSRNLRVWEFFNHLGGQNIGLGYLVQCWNLCAWNITE